MKGFTLVLDAHSDQQTKQSIEEDFSGFLAKVSPQGEVPLVSHGSFVLKPGHENFLGISAINTVSKDIEKIGPEDKGCLYGHELKLKFHKTYTQSNCLLECQIKYAQDRTNCHPWYFPSFDVTHICDPWKARRFMNHFGQVPRRTCVHCLPGCDSTIYKASLSNAPIRYKQVLQEDSEAVTNGQ